jgi:hypothetical protein
LNNAGIKERIVLYKQYVEDAVAEGRKGDAYDFRQTLEKLQKEQAIIDEEARRLEKERKAAEDK